MEFVKSSKQIGLKAADPKEGKMFPTIAMLVDPANFNGTPHLDLGLIVFLWFFCGLFV